MVMMGIYFTTPKVIVINYNGNFLSLIAKGRNFRKMIRFNVSPECILVNKKDDEKIDNALLFGA